MKSSCILDINPLSDKWFINILSHSVGCLFIFLMVSFAVQSFSVWHSLSWLFWLLLTFFGGGQNSCPKLQSQWDYCLCFPQEFYDFRSYIQVFQSVQFSCSVMSESSQSHGLQHTRLPCPAATPGACSNSYPLSLWCHPTVLSSVAPFSSCLQSFPASGSFPVSQLFTSGGQRTGATASASVLPVNIQDWSPLGWTGWISLQSKGLSRVFSNTTVQKHQFFNTQLSLWPNSHIHTWLLEKPKLWLHGLCWQSNVSTF